MKEQSLPTHQRVQNPPHAVTDEVPVVRDDLLRYMVNLL